MLEILYNVIQIAAPGIKSIAEVNEPQSRCLEYLGRPGFVEGDMVYQFSAFPLAIHAEVKGDVSQFAKWLSTMRAFNGKQFITVLGSHDGLSQKQARELLPADDLKLLQDTLLEKRGGKANYASAQGVKIVYEICGTPWALVNGGSTDTREVQLARYLSILSMGLLARGMPGLYVSGMLGADNYVPPEGLDEFRTLNRESYDIEHIHKVMKDETSREGTTFKAIETVLKVRASLPQFDRNAPEPVVLETSDKAVLAVILWGPKGASCPPLLAIVNISPEEKSARLHGLPSQLLGTTLKDVLEGAGGVAKVKKAGGLTRRNSRSILGGVSASVLLTWTPDYTTELAPYEFQWLLPLTDGDE